MVAKKIPNLVPPKKKVKTTVTQKKPASKSNTQAKPKKIPKKTDLPTAAIIRIAKANGAERVGSDGADLILKMTEAYIGKLAKEANKLATDTGRKTLRTEDIEMASQQI